MKEINTTQIIQGTLAAVKTEEPIDSVMLKSPVKEGVAVNLLSELDGNLKKIEDLTHRLGFMMREVSYVLNKKI